MSATAKDMDQQFHDLDNLIAEDKPEEKLTDETQLDAIDELLGLGEKNDSTRKPEKDTGEPGDDNTRQAEDESAADDESGNEDEESEDRGDVDESAEDEENDAVNYEVEVPMAEGIEPMTVGALKDAEVNRQQREENITKEQAANLETRYELDSVISTLAAIGQLPQETRAMIQHNRQAHTVRENKATLEAIPEWKDNKIFLEDHKDITKLAERFGFSAGEVKSAEDHRLIHAFREFALTIKKIETAKARPTKKINRKHTSRKGKKLSGDKEKQMIDAAANSENQGFKDAAIAKLLEN